MFVAVSIGKDLRGPESSLESYTMCPAVSNDDVLKGSTLALSRETYSLDRLQILVLHVQSREHQSSENCPWLPHFFYLCGSWVELAS